MALTPRRRVPPAPPGKSSRTGWQDSHFRCYRNGSLGCAGRFGSLKCPRQEPGPGLACPADRRVQFRPFHYLCTTLYGTMVSLEKISVSFGGFELLREISLLVGPRDRIGLTGRNGSGKTTLLRIIAGLASPSSGKVSAPRELVIGYLPQQMEVADLRTVWQETESAFDHILTLRDEIGTLQQEISGRHDFHSGDYLRLLEEVHEKNDRYLLLGGNNCEADIEQALTGLGFERSDFSRNTSEFSGGWRMRIELAKLLLRKPDLLLLDEPTNHLDIESIQWLEDYLKFFRGSVILVSHDRAFLDNVTTRTVEISLGRISDQKMNYTAFRRWKEEQRAQQLAAYRNQQKMIADTERFIERFRYKATKAVQVQSRIKSLEKIDRLEIEPEDNQAVLIRFTQVPRSGNVVLEARDIGKCYGELEVLKGVDLSVARGEKIAFVGRNGEGKTTLARILMQEIGFSGSLQIGHNVRIGYFAQNQADLLDPGLTVLETIDRVAAGEIRTRIRDMLGAFLFSGEEVDKKVSVLSGGERSRLAMISLLLEPVNFLILDEPTNHLDMQSKDILKQALVNFDGTVLVVSHDRDFLDGLVTCVYEFRNKKIRQHLGGIYDFLRKKKLDSLRELEKRSSAQRAAQELRDSPGESASQEVSFEMRKEINRVISRTEKKIAGIEEGITRMEVQLAEMDQLLADSSRITSGGFFTDYEQLKGALALALEEWEKEHLELEKWKEKKNW